MRRAPIVIGRHRRRHRRASWASMPTPAVPTATRVDRARRRPPTPTPTATTPGTSTRLAAASGTATGDAIDTRYGVAQVRVTVSGGKITKVEAVQLQGTDPKSVQISSSAEPILQQSVLTKQTAAVDAVSGATYTSASYEASLQSALDKLGFKAADGSRATLQVPAGGGDGF